MKEISNSEKFVRDILDNYPDQNKHVWLCSRADEQSGVVIYMPIMEKCQYKTEFNSKYEAYLINQESDEIKKLKQNDVVDPEPHLFSKRCNKRYLLALVVKSSHQTAYTIMGLRTKICPEKPYLDRKFNQYTYSVYDLESIRIVITITNIESYLITGYQQMSQFVERNEDLFKDLAKEFILSHLGLSDSKKNETFKDVLNSRDFIKDSGLRVVEVRGISRKSVAPSKDIADQLYYFEANQRLKDKRSISIQHGQEIDEAHHRNQLQMIQAQGNAEADKIRYNNQIYQKAVNYCLERLKERGKVANELQMWKDIEQFKKQYGIKLKTSEIMRHVISNPRCPKDPIIG